MADLKDLLEALADDQDIPIKREDLARSTERLAPRGGFGFAPAIDFGPKTICLIKQAVKLGMCVWKNKDDRDKIKECVEKFLEDAAGCYGIGGR